MYNSYKIVIYTLLVFLYGFYNIFPCRPKLRTTRHYTQLKIERQQEENDINKNGKVNGKAIINFCNDGDMDGC